jgi:hypothetical protein
MMHLWPLLSLFVGCSVVLVDEPCDTATPSSEDTGALPELMFVSAGTGATHSCGILADEALYCWGLGDEGQLDVPEGSFGSLSVGHAHACALDVDGDASCWGRNDDGQIELAGSYTAVSAGGAHSCGLDARGTVTCVGRNNEGQTAVPDYTFLSVAAGEKHTCGIVRLDNGRNGSVCWGELKKEVQSDEAPVRVISGANWSCVESETGLSCFGPNVHSSEPVPDSIQVGTAAMGKDHGCGLSSDGTVQCWGSSDLGQTNAPEGVFQAVFSGPTSMHTCGLRAASERAAPLTCWGLDAENQLEP